MSTPRRTRAKSKKTMAANPPPTTPPEPYPNPFADLVDAREHFADRGMGPDGWKRIELTVIAAGDGPNLVLSWPTG